MAGWVLYHSSIGTMRYRADRCIRGHGCKLTELLSVSQNYCLANVSVFDWYQYVLGILGGWMAGVYGGFTSSAEFIDGAQRDFILHIVYAFLKL
jgi:hypothetical protein